MGGKIIIQNFMSFYTNIGKISNSLNSRMVSVPNHRFNPLRRHWMDLYTPISEELKLNIRMNLKTRTVEIATKVETEDFGTLQKGFDFINAFILGFNVNDAAALISSDELFMQTFDLKDVATLKRKHLSRSVGRLVGKEGRVKTNIENITRTRVVIANNRVHLLGTYNNIRIVRDAICHLIL